MARRNTALRPIDFNDDVQSLGIPWITEKMFLTDRDPVFRRFNAMVWAILDATELRDAYAPLLAAGRAYRRLVSSYDREYAEYDDEFLANWERGV